MKKVFFSISSIAFLFFSHTTKAQYENYPALFERQTSFGGTARYAAIGGAATALGGDLGAATVNPAGLGMYRKSEFSFSPNIGAGGSDTKFLNTTTHETKGSFGISNIGIAICGVKDVLDKSDWKGGTFSLGMSRTNSFHNRISFAGNDDQNSIADYFVQRAAGVSEADLYNGDPLTYLPYSVYLIDPDSTGNPHPGPQYTNHFDDAGTGGFGYMYKEGSYTTKGGQYQWNIAYGGNYKDKLFIGGGLGITSINFREDLTYSEVHYYDGVTNAFNSLTFNDYNKIKGTGVNFKLGFIYKAIDAFRFGATVTTPTYYWMNQESSSDMTVVFPSDLQDGQGNYLGTQSNSTDPSFFRFHYTAPAKLALGSAVFIGKSGFISADVEYIPYKTSDISGNSNADDRALQPFNTTIRNNYNNVVNIKLGGELRLDIFKLRIGGAYLPNPYKNSDAVNDASFPQIRVVVPNKDITQITGGVGVKLNDIYFDLGIVNMRYASGYQPYSVDRDASYYNSNNTYDLGPSAKSTSKSSITNIVLTMGFYFE